MAAVLILIGGFTVAYLGGLGYLPIDPWIAVPATLVIVFLLTCMLPFAMSSSSSFYMNRGAVAQPKSPDNNSINRVLRDLSIEREYLLRGTRGMTIRDALLSEWPFSGRDPLSNWQVVDELGNDVTDKLLSDLDGIACH